MIVRTTLKTAASTFIAMVLSVFFAFSASGEPVAESVGTGHAGTVPPKIFLNGEALLDDFLLAAREGVMFIPLSDEMEFSLDAVLEQDPLSPVTKIELRTSDAVLVFTESEISFEANGIQRELRKRPFMLNGHLHVPLEDLFLHLGCEIRRDGDEIHITKQDAITDVINEIPDSFLKRKPREPAEQPVEEQPVEGELPETQYGVQYTYENTFEFENIAVSGDESLSNLVPKTDFYHRLSLRFMGEFENSYKLNSILKTASTTDRILNEGEVTTFNLSLNNNRNLFSFYDNAPRVSRYTLKSHQSRGMLYGRNLGKSQMSVIWGKSPKKLKETRYNRYLQALFWDRKTETGGVGVSLVRIKDTGVPQDTDRLNNKVISFNASTKKKGIKANAELAHSITERFDRAEARALAKWVDLNYKNKTTTVVARYERIGSEFVSETSFFTPGSREFLLFINHRVTRRIIVGGGYRRMRLLGESTAFTPVLITVSPFVKRPKLRIKLLDNFEKSRGMLGTRITDKKKFLLSDRVGKAKVDFTLERKKQKDTLASWSFRTSRRYRYITPVSKKTMVILQHKNEYKSSSSNPRKRYYQAKITYEPIEWTEISLNMERYYNNTPNDRRTVSSSYKKIDIFNDREYQVEMGLSNYRDHNDLVFRLSYSYYK
ncbi:hypothetical protein ACFLQK_00300 [bacterium]